MRFTRLLPMDVGLKPGTGVPGSAGPWAGATAPPEYLGELWLQERLGVGLELLEHLLRVGRTVGEPQYLRVKGGLHRREANGGYLWERVGVTLHEGGHVRGPGGAAGHGCVVCSAAHCVATLGRDGMTPNALANLSCWAGEARYFTKLTSAAVYLLAAAMPQQLVKTSVP